MSKCVFFPGMCNTQMTLFSLSYAVSSRQRQQYAPSVLPSTLCTMIQTKEMFSTTYSTPSMEDGCTMRKWPAKHGPESQFLVMAKAHLPVLFDIHNFTQRRHNSVFMVWSKPMKLQATAPTPITRIFPHWPKGFTIQHSLSKPHCVMDITPLRTPLPLNGSNTYRGALLTLLKTIL